MWIRNLLKILQIVCFPCNVLSFLFTSIAIIRKNKKFCELNKGPVTAGGSWGVGSESWSGVAPFGRPRTWSPRGKIRSRGLTKGRRPPSKPQYVRVRSPSPKIIVKTFYLNPTKIGCFKTLWALNPRPSDY